MAAAQQGVDCLAMPFRKLTTAVAEFGCVLQREQGVFLQVG